MLDRICLFFFFQAEDGIRDWSVTGVQTCALPISRDGRIHHASYFRLLRDIRAAGECPASGGFDLTNCFLGGLLRLAVVHHDGRALRSEERRVGKEWRSWWSGCHLKKKQHGYDALW